MYFIFEMAFIKAILNSTSHTEHAKHVRSIKVTQTVLFLIFGLFYVPTNLVIFIYKKELREIIKSKQKDTFKTPCEEWYNSSLDNILTLLK